MFDDDCPDYFLGDDDDEPQSRQTASRHAPRATDSTDRRVIYFNEPQERTHSVNADDDDESTPYGDGGCLFSGGGCLSPKARGGCSCMAVVMVALIVGLCVGYLRYFSPHVTNASMDVRVVEVYQKGTLFKTNEAVVEDHKGLHTNVSVPSTRLFQQLQQLQGTDSTIHVYYEEYYATVPWRGESTIILTE